MYVNTRMWKHCTFVSRIFGCDKIYYSTYYIIIIIILKWNLIPNTLFEILFSFYINIELYLQHFQKVFKVFF
jgi:hypothetical protein